MDYIYAPPPPPPKSKLQAAKPVPRKITKKNNPNTTFTKQEIKRDITKSEPLNPLNLPTHLPNSHPGQPISSKGPDTQIEEQIEEDETDEDIDEEKTLIQIQGTNITLQTEEDIARWIEDRKKNWPSAEKIESKRKERQLQLEIQQNKQIQSRKRGLEENQNQIQDKDKRGKRICKFYSINQKCRHGDNCRNLHQNLSELKKNNETKVNIPDRFGPIQNKAKSLFNMLRHKEYDAENKSVLEFMEYLSDIGLIE